MINYGYSLKFIDKRGIQKLGINKLSDLADKENLL